MHNVNDSRWLSEDQHPRYYRNDPNSCKTCHGTNLRGTVLSRAFAPRTFRAEDIGNVSVAKGEKIGCYTCHDGPDGGD